MTTVSLLWIRKTLLLTMTTFKIEKADTFFKRLRGLIGRKNLPPEYGLMIVPCNSIHMLFMRFAIDAIFIDKNFVIKKIDANLQTWTGISFCKGAWAVVEVKAGESARLNLKVGQTLQFEYI